jgi:hypothetical protein
VRIYLLLGGAALALTACNQSAPNAPPTPASTDPAKMLTPRLVGEWEYTTQMSITGVQGVAPAMEQRMRGLSPPAEIRRECLSKPETQADVDKMFEAGSNGCKFTKIATPPDKIAGTAACSAANGGTGGGTVSGSLHPTSLDLTMKLESRMPMPDKTAASVEMLMTMTAKRIGDCPK